MLLVKNYESCQEEVLTSTSDPYPTEILQQNPCSDPDWTLIFRLRIANIPSAYAYITYTTILALRYKNYSERLYIYNMQLHWLYDIKTIPSAYTYITYTTMLALLY